MRRWLRSRKAAPPTAEGRFKTLYKVYAERIGGFKLTPPPEDWDGAYALETK